MKASTSIKPQQSKKFPVWLLFIIGAGVVLIAVAVIGVNRAATPTAVPAVTGAPALQVDKEKVDLGNVTLGQTVEAKFEVTNVGDQPLRFTKKPYIEVIEGC